MSYFSYRFLLLITIISLILAPLPAPANAQEPIPPDIIIIITDDQPWHTQQFMPLTNELIGGHGVTFTNAYVSTPFCCPSRASILTGQYAHNHGTIGNNVPFGGATLFDDSSTLATWLKNAGYRTGLIGKYLNEYFKIPQYIPPGWDQWYAFTNRSLGLTGGYLDYSLNENGIEVNYNGTGSNTYSTNVLRDKAVGFIQSTPSDQPLFLYFSTNAPHTAIVPDPVDEGLFEDLPPYRPPSYNELDISDKPSWLETQPVLSASQLAEADELYRLQVLALQSVDRAVQAIVQTLQDTRRLDNAVIIYTSDNGYSLGEHRLTRKNCVYEACIKVPLLVRAPDLTPRTDAHLVENIDLPVTMADFAGIDPPVPVDGLSIVDLLHNPEVPWREDILVEVTDRHNIWQRNFQAVHTSQYVYAEYPNGEREFYNLAIDPDQLESQIENPAYSTVVEELARRLQTYKGQTDLSLSLSASTPLIYSGKTVDFTFTVTNNGPLAAAPLILTYEVPPGMSFVSCQPGAVALCISDSSGRGVVISILRPGSDHQVEITLRSETSQPLQVTAQVSAFTPLESEPGDNTASLMFNPFRFYLPLIQQ